MISECHATAGWQLRSLPGYGPHLIRRFQRRVGIIWDDGESGLVAWAVGRPNGRTSKAGRCGTVAAARYAADRAAHRHSLAHLLPWSHR